MRDIVWSCAALARSDRAVGATWLYPHPVFKDTATAWMADLRERGAEDEYLFSVNRYCFLAVAE